MSDSASPFPFDMIGFDLDGTLLDTSADLAAATNHALALVGRPALSPDRIRAMIGGGAERMLALALAETGGADPQLLARGYPALLDFYGDNLTAGTVAFPGMIDTLDALAARGVKLAVVTNKRAAFTRPLLRNIGLTDRFDCILSGDTLGPGSAKPSPALIHEMIQRCGGGRAAFVGDSTFDMLAARNAGIPGVAVSFGFANAPIEQLGADAVIDHYDELVPALLRLGDGRAATSSTNAAPA